MRLWGLEGRRGGQDCKSKSYRRHPRLLLSCRSESGGNQEEQHFQVITEVERRHQRTLNDPIFCFFSPPLLPLKVVSKLFWVWIAQGFGNVEPGSGQGNLCLRLYKIASKRGAIEERCDALKFWGAMTDQGEQCRLSG